MFALMSVLNAICAMSMTPALLKDLMDFYKQKDIGYEESDNLSGGKQR